MIKFFHRRTKQEYILTIEAHRALITDPTVPPDRTTIQNSVVWFRVTLSGEDHVIQAVGDYSQDMNLAITSAIMSLDAAYYGNLPPNPTGTPPAPDKGR